VLHTQCGKGFTRIDEGIFRKGGRASGVSTRWKGERKARELRGW